MQQFQVTVTAPVGLSSSIDSLVEEVRCGFRYSWVQKSTRCSGARDPDCPATVRPLSWILTPSPRFILTRIMCAHRGTAWSLKRFHFETAAQDFPGGPVVNSPPASAMDNGFCPWSGMIPCALGQLIPCARTPELVRSGACAPHSEAIATRSPLRATKT